MFKISASLKAKIYQNNNQITFTSLRMIKDDVNVKYLTSLAITQIWASHGSVIGIPIPITDIAIFNNTDTDVDI